MLPSQKQSSRQYEIFNDTKHNISSDLLNAKSSIIYLLWLKKKNGHLKLANINGLLFIQLFLFRFAKKLL